MHLLKWSYQPKQRSGSWVSTIRTQRAQVRQLLDDSPSLRAFVERMTRINRGRALFTRPDRLGEYLLVDYIARKRKRV